MGYHQMFKWRQWLARCICSCRREGRHQVRQDPVRSERPELVVKVTLGVIPGAHLCYGEEREGPSLCDPLEVRRLWGSCRWIQGAAWWWGDESVDILTLLAKDFKEGLDFGEMVICNIKSRTRPSEQ